MSSIITLIFGGEVATTKNLPVVSNDVGYTAYSEVATTIHRPRHVEPPYTTLAHNPRAGMKERDVAHPSIWDMLGSGFSATLNFLEDELGKAPKYTFRDADNPYYGL
jgi:hypothetical protein